MILFVSEGGTVDSHFPNLSNCYQRPWKEAKDWAYTLRAVRYLEPEYLEYSWSESIVRAVNMMIRIAAYIATPLAAVAAVYLAVAVSIPLSLAGLTLTVLLHETYQLSRNLEFQYANGQKHFRVFIFAQNTFILKNLGGCYAGNT